MKVNGPPHTPYLFELSPGERHSPLWIKLVEHFNVRLSTLREQNDQRLSAEETALLRGEINCLKALIRLGDD